MACRPARSELGLQVLGRWDKTRQSWPLTRNGVGLGGAVPAPLAREPEGVGCSPHPACPAPGSLLTHWVGKVLWEGTNPPPPLGALGAVPPTRPHFGDTLPPATSSRLLSSVSSSAWALARGASPGCGPARDQSWQGSGKEASRLRGGAARKPRLSCRWQGRKLAAAAWRLPGACPCSWGNSQRGCGGGGPAALLAAGPGVSGSGRGPWGVAVSGHKGPQHPTANLLPGPEPRPPPAQDQASPQ